MALFGGLAEPEDRLLWIPRNAGSCGIAVSEKKLTIGITLFGNLAIPGDRLLWIPRNAGSISFALFGHSL